MVPGRVSAQSQVVLHHSVSLSLILMVTQIPQLNQLFQLVSAGLVYLPTSRFSSLCLSVCKVCPSSARVSVVPRDTSPMVFFDPGRLPPGPAAAGRLWLSQRLSLDVSSLIVSFWFIIVSFCCRTVSRSCMTVVFRSSAGPLFCIVAVHRSISLGTDVQINCVCPKSCAALSMTTKQESRKSFRENVSMVPERQSRRACGRHRETVVSKRFQHHGAVRWNWALHGRSAHFI